MKPIVVASFLVVLTASGGSPASDSDSVAARQAASPYPYNAPYGL